MRCVTPVKTVGSTNQPPARRGSVGTRPPAASVAPSPRAMSMYDSTLSCCAFEMIAPIVVAGSVGGPGT